jgi:glucose/arabinose dehydrogenase
MPPPDGSAVTRAFGHLLSRPHTGLVRVNRRLLALAACAALAAATLSCTGADEPPKVDGAQAATFSAELLSPPEGATVSVPFLVQLIVAGERDEIAIKQSSGAERPLRVEVWTEGPGRPRKLGDAEPGPYDEITRRQLFGLQAGGLGDGEHDIAVFVVPAGSDAAIEPLRRRIVVAARGGGLTTHVDEPYDGQPISLPFLIEGWALDTRAQRGTGVDRVEVWDGPRDGGTMLGTATYGFYRPDLAGPARDTRYNSAGFSFSLRELEPGDHALHVYARESGGGFGEPVVVNVRVGSRPMAPANPDIDVFADGLAFPAAIALAPDGRLFYGELSDGSIGVLSPDGAERTAFAELAVASRGETGLLSIALHPQYAENRQVYVLYSVPDAEGNAVEHRIVRFVDNGGAAAAPETVVGGLPASSTGMHNGGAMAFGADGMLYVSTGDNELPLEADMPGSLLGKILRLTPEGDVPPDNPQAGSPVYASGFRNVFGLGFQPPLGRLWATDNGVDSDDELNAVAPGAHYGWPAVRGAAGVPPYLDPALTLTPSVGPTNLAFTDERTLWFCDVVTASLHRVRLGGAALEEVESHELVGPGCALGLAAAPDGTLYFSDGTAIYRYRPG